MRKVSYDLTKHTDEFRDFAMWYWKENCSERMAYGEETLSFKEYCENYYDFLLDKFRKGEYNTN